MKHRIAVLLFTALFVRSAQASLLVDEGFSGYTTDQTVVGQGPATTGFTGDWANDGNALGSNADYYPRSGGLTYSGYAPNSAGLLEAFRVDGTFSGSSTDKAVIRDFSGYTVSDTEDMYISLLFDNNSTSAAALTELRFLELDNTINDNRDSRLEINHTSGEATFRAGGNSGTTHTESMIAGTHLLIIRAIDDNVPGSNPNPDYYDAIEIWLNPTINATGSPTPADLGTPDATGYGIMRNFAGAGALPYSQFRFSHDLESGDVKVDEIAVTHSLSDIVAIPEPRTLALVGIALGTARLGDNWGADGGRNQERKLPLMLAGKAIGHDGMLEYADAEDWNHPPLFDYYDRFYRMQTDPDTAIGRGVNQIQTFTRHM